MAKKSRTPAPPRAVQAPKARGSERSRPSLGGSGRWIAVAVAVVLVIAAVAAAVSLGSGKSTKAKATTGQLAAAMTAAGCTLHTYPSIGRGHITTLDPKPPIKYNSFPPTSGKHYYVPAVWGSYDTPVSEYQAIHNLEADRPTAASLVTDSSGVCSGVLPLDRSGLWELRFAVARGADRFTASLRRELARSGAPR